MKLVIKPKEYRKCCSIRIAGMFEHDKNIIQLQHDYQTIYNIKFCNSIFGGFNCEWHSGRIVNDISWDMMKGRFYALLSKYHSVGITCNFVFSRPDVPVNILDNPVCNEILDMIYTANITQNAKHGVIVASDRLRDYIRNKAPNVPITCSLLRTSIAYKDCSEEPSYYDDMADLYDNVVLRPDWICRPDYLAQIRNKDKMEMNMTDHCVYMCKLRGHRYQAIDDVCRNIPGSYERLEQISEICRKGKISKPHIRADDIYIENLIDIGIKRFKVSGRIRTWEQFYDKIQNMFYYVTPSYE